MSLGWKVIILLSIVSALLVGTTYAVQYFVVWPGFIRAEFAEAQEDLGRCVSAVQRDCEHLSTFVYDWGSWDDTYRYMEQRNEDYENANLIPNTFSNAHINLAAFVRPNGEMVMGKVFDLEKKDWIDAPDLLREICRRDHPLVALKDEKSKMAGLLLTEIGPMLVASRPILKSDDTGPSRGVVIMGRLITGDSIAELAQRTRVDLKLWPITDEAIPEHDRKALAAVTSRNTAFVEACDSKISHGYSVIRDLFGRPAMLLRADLPRNISQRGSKAAQAATACSAAGGVSILIVMWLLLRRMVIKPLTVVTKHAVRVGGAGDLEARLNMPRRDEIGVLAGQFDRMVGQLAESRARVVGIARRAGMAEVATDVLHNVGNVLNSVNVSAGVVTQKLRQSEVPSLGMAAKMMIDHQQDLAQFVTADERGRQLPGYLAQLADFLTDEQNAMLSEMKSLTDSIEHIKQVINLQQIHSKTAALIETVEPADVLEEAIRLNLDSFQRHHIEVTREFAPLGPVPMDKHKVLQTLVNLLSNAKNALKESGRDSSRRIVIQAAMVKNNDVERLRIIVIDNGAGIAPENLTRIFAFGFSTRPGGHGIGLHSAANMAREMGGRLTAASDGPGKGAAFTLELPVARREVAA